MLPFFSLLWSSWNSGGCGLTFGLGEVPPTTPQLRSASKPLSQVKVLFDDLASHSSKHRCFSRSGLKHEAAPVLLPVLQSPKTPAMSAPATTTPPCRPVNRRRCACSAARGTAFMKVTHPYRESAGSVVLIRRWPLELDVQWYQSEFHKPMMSFTWDPDTLPLGLPSTLKSLHVQCC